MVDRPRLLGVLMAVLLAGIAYIIVLSVKGVPFQHRHTLMLDVPAAAPPLQAGDQVRIGGQRAGIVRAVAPRADRGRLTLDLLPRFWPLGRDTRARVRTKVGSGLTYVELTPAGPGEIAEGGGIPLSRSRAGTTLPQAAEAFDAATRTALARDVTVGGSALAGQGEDINIAIGQLRDSLDDGTAQLDALTPTPGALSRLIDGTAQVSDALAGAGGDAPLTGAIEQGAAVVQALDARRADLGATLDAAPGLERRFTAVAPGADALLDRTASLVGDVTPAVRDLHAALPAVRSFLAAGAATRTQVDRLAPPIAALLDAAPPALRAMAGPVAMLDPLASSLGPVGALLTPYKADMLAGVRGLEAVTSKSYDAGTTAAGNPALRFAPVITCATGRNPLPDPGQAAHDKTAVGAC